MIVSGLKEYVKRHEIVCRDKEDITMPNIKWISAYNFSFVDNLSLSYHSHLPLLLTQFFSSWCYNYFYQSALGKNPHSTFLHLLTASFLYHYSSLLTFLKENELIGKNISLLALIFKITKENYFGTGCYCCFFCLFYAFSAVKISACQLFHVFKIFLHGFLKFLFWNELYI